MKLVKAKIRGTGHPIDGHTYALLDDGDGYFSMGSPLKGDGAAEEALMLTCHKTDDLYSNEPIEKFRELWESGTYEPPGLFILKAGNVEVVEVMKDDDVQKPKIKFEWIIGIQRATMRIFEEQDTEPGYVNNRAVSANERAIKHYLSKITSDEGEQRKILDIIEGENFNMQDPTFRPILKKLRAIGYEVVK